jgi:hypothetical protein
MRTTTAFTTAVLAGAFALGTAGFEPALAKKGGGHPPGFSHGVKAGWHGAGHPPGWSHG